MIYCIVPRELAPELHGVLRELYADDSGVEVVVERREGERRKAGAPAGGRRKAERRAELVPAAAEERPLPPAVEPHRERLNWVERAAHAKLTEEDRGTALLVKRAQRGDERAFDTLYLRYFDRVFGYLRNTLHDHHEAEDATQEVFTSMFQALPDYEERGAPFRAWLFRLARNNALDRLKRSDKIVLEDPSELAQRIEAAGDASAADVRASEWLSDSVLSGLIERLPLAQRQVILMRYLLDLAYADIGMAIDRSPEAVRQLHQRAMRALRPRLTALRERRKEEGFGEPMRAIPKQAWVVRSRKFNFL